MAWSSIVRAGAPSPTTSTGAASLLPSLLLDSVASSRDASIAVAVVDANALISSSCSTRLITLSSRFVSVREVLDEIRDPMSRFQLASLPFTVECVEPSEDAVRKVTQFARETGDLHSLSDVDLKLIALTYMLEQQAHGTGRLRDHPPPLQVIQSRNVRERDLPGWGSNVQNLEEWEELSARDQHDDNGENQVSHILGLRNLGLDAIEQDGHGSDMIQLDTEKDIHPDTQIDNHVEEHDSTKEDKVLSLKETVIESENTTEMVKSYGVNAASETINKIDSENLSKTIQMLEGEDGQQEDGDWQKAVSRTTRRKHEKRAARAALRNLSLKDNESESNSMLHPNEALSNANPQSGTEKCLDQMEDCQSCVSQESDNSDAAAGASQPTDGYSESKNGDDSIHGEPPASVSAADSEDSWMLCPLSNSNIACITADFPMQNVLLQIGLRVISPNGLQVQKLHRWVLKCEACRHVTSDVGRIFCPKCGNGGTLHKMSSTVGLNGVVHTGTRRRTNIRGTRYSLPMPKGGRQGVSENPILREDQLPQRMLHPKKKKVSLNDPPTFSEMFEVKSTRVGKIQPPIREALAVFSGKRNPNDCRSRPRR